MCINKYIYIYILYIYIYMCVCVRIFSYAVEMSNAKSNSPTGLQCVYIEQ